VDIKTRRPVTNPQHSNMSFCIMTCCQQIEVVEFGLQSHVQSDVTKLN